MTAAAARPDIDGNYPVRSIAGPVLIPPLRTQFPAVPRQLRTLHGPGFKGWTARFAAICLGLLALCFTAFALQTLLLPFLGSIAEATITQVHPGGKVGAYEASYLYTVNGKTYHSQGFVDPAIARDAGVALATYQRVTAPVRHFEIGSYSVSEFNDIPLPNSLVPLALLSLVLIGATARMGNTGWLERPRTRALLTTGTAAAGLVTHASKSAAVRWFPRHSVGIQYLFQNKICRRQVRISTQAAKKLAPGTSITVFHNPQHPLTCVIYEAVGHCEIITPPSA